MPPSTSHANLSFIGLLLLLLVAFFPGAFHYLWTLPLALVSSRWTAAPPQPPAGAAALCPAPSHAMSWFQKSFTLPPRSRGSYLVTDHVLQELPELKAYKVGILHLFVQHTSCGLSLNENWDEDVRTDMSDALDRIVPSAGPKNQQLYRHSAEGPDDMPVRPTLFASTVRHPSGHRTTR